MEEGPPPISNLIGKRYNSGTHGTNLISNVLGQTGLFSYPKSIYTVADFIEFVTFDRTNALVLDFFAGSGTTLNAVNLLNAMDGGSRRCIMVTNNEVSEEEAQSLKIQGYEQGQAEWEQQGICQSVTWPRSRYTILGRRDDGSELDGEYLTGKTVEKEKPRKFRQIAFTSIDDLTTAAQKKQLVALIEGIPQSEVTRDSAFVVSEKHPVSILFDDSQADAWLEALEGQEHMTDFYMVTAQKATFDDLKARIHDRLGPVVVTEEEKRPLRDGFPANLEYFRLDFLDKDHVALGRQFREILPILWLRAGAIGDAASADIDRHFQQAGQLLGNGLHMDYWRDQGSRDANEVKVEAVVLAQERDSMKKLEDFAEGEFNALYIRHKQNIAKLKEQRKQHFERLCLASSVPQEIPWTLPDSIDFRRSSEATEYDKHLFLEEDNKFRADLGSWEHEVLQEELADESVIGWLRNMDRKSWSLEIPYGEAGSEKPMFPDLLVIRQNPEGFLFDILEPHAPNLKDNISKARGLAKFAQKHWGLFDRIQLIRKQRSAGGLERYVRLDVGDLAIWKRVSAMRSNDELDQIFDEKA